MSQPELSSGGGSSLSSGKLSKLLVSVGDATLGIMGGVKVPFLKPSQLKPSNHLCF